MKGAARAALALVSAAVYLGATIWAFGGAAAFFSHPPLVALFAGGNISPGIREDRGNRWVLIPVLAFGFGIAFLAPWTDRIGFWTIDGNAVRWLGVAITAAGGALRIAPVFVLGNRFSGLVAIQPNHELVTGGLYSVIRHPSYLGLLLASLGWSLAFRSLVGVLLTLLLVPPILVRIRAEEAMLHSQFGSEYEAYRARTSRLIPGVY
jgi:protein-S-isoprenylcysteine O-methyltransferase Ste14